MAVLARRSLWLASAPDTPEMLIISASCFDLVQLSWPVHAKMHLISSWLCQMCCVPQSFWAVWRCLWGRNASWPWFHSKSLQNQLLQQHTATVCCGELLECFLPLCQYDCQRSFQRPFQPRHSAKSCTIFASRSFRIPQKFWWVCVASKTPRGHFIHTIYCTMIYKNKPTDP